jgi:hypothetical protein
MLAHSHPHNSTYNPMKAEPNKPSPHTQNTIGKQPELRKQSFPRPQVWCKIFRSHTHTKRKNKITTTKNTSTTKVEAKNLRSGASGTG